MFKRQLLFPVFLVFLLKHKVTFASMCPSNRYPEYDIYLQGFTLESFKVNTVFQCYKRCEENIYCLSINFNLSSKKCKLKYSTKTRHPEKKVRKGNTVYMEAKDDLGPPGSRPDRPIPSCKKLKEDDRQAKSGVYWMRFNEPSSAPFQVFCDMTTDGGGWTLVWSYTFLQYSSYYSKSNAVTPIPNWPVDKSSGSWVPESTTTPVSHSSRAAMDFALWKKIGRGFLIKSNITNWVACEEGTGSLVNWVEGNVVCRVVKTVTSTCTTTAPDTFLPSTHSSPTLMVSGNSVTYPIQFFLDGRKDKYYPTHDPCGTDSQDNNLIDDVANPGGAIYIR